MYCHKCGNRLTTESLFCNRCGSKVQGQNATEKPRAAHLAVPPPRPARRAPIAHDAQEAEQPEEYDEYDEYDQEASYAPARRGPARYERERDDRDYYEYSNNEEQVI